MIIGHIADGTILFLQVTASAFMAADYFFDSTQRDAINSVIKDEVDRLRGSIQQKWKDSFDVIFVTEWARTLTAILLALVSVPIWFLIKYAGDVVGPLGQALLSLVFLALFVSYFNYFVKVLIGHFSSFIFGSALWGAAFFISYCKKGSVFGIGFIFLMASFVCRYLNLT
jgi:hypothetical protein